MKLNTINIHANCRKNNDLQRRARKRLAPEGAPSATLPRPAAARWAWPEPRALGMAVAAAPPPEGRLPGTARGRRGIRAEALEPPLAFPIPPEARWRAGGRRRSRRLRARPMPVDGTVQGTGTSPLSRQGSPSLRASSPQGLARDPGRLAVLAAAHSLPGARPPSSARLPRGAPGPSTQGLRRSRCVARCRSPPLSPAVPSASSSSAHPLRTKQIGRASCRERVSSPV